MGLPVVVACCLTSRLQSWSKKYTSSVGEGECVTPTVRDIVGGYVAPGKGNKTRLLQVPLLEQDKEEESIASQSAPFRGLLSLICLIAIISRAASSSRSSRNDQHQAGSWDGAVDKVEKHAFGCSVRQACDYVHRPKRPEVDADTRRCLGSSTSLFAPERSEVRLSTNRALVSWHETESSGLFVWVVRLGRLGRLVRKRNNSRFSTSPNEPQDRVEPENFLQFYPDDAMLGQQFKGGVLCNLFNHSLSSLCTTNPEMLQCLPVHTGQLLCYSCRCDAKDQCCGRQAGRKLRSAFGAVGQGSEVPEPSLCAPGWPVRRILTPTDNKGIVNPQQLGSFGKYGQGPPCIYLHRGGHRFLV
ncbi:hypothetical protein A9K55_000294 [Cordyceps militaris]|uniref:Uncharacterized protein n=1 Tax=Cordyceps militaris TaxID=73501 RepID=A0A2H4SVX1_CORMI|nr:hypothetical protein A9K55_000294 [Cordyceps militaris]